MMYSPDLDDAPLVMVDVAPLGICSINPSDDTGPPIAAGTISRPSAKLQLANMSRQAMFPPGWMGGDSCHLPESQECRGGFRLRLDRNKSTSMQEGHVAIAGCRPHEELLFFDESKRLVAGEMFFVGKKCSNKYESEVRGSVVSATYLRSDHPLIDEEVPCILTGYALASKSAYDKITCFPCASETLSCMITSETMVRILPGAELKALQSGCVDDPLHRRLLQGVETKSTAALTGLSFHDDEIVDSLSIRMSTMLSNVSRVGTRNDSIRRREKREKELETTIAELDSYWSAMTNAMDEVRKDNEALPLLLREGAMLVSNSTPNSGKTKLVESIALERLGCDAVHIVSASSLFAKYGTQADSALEITLHDIVLASAIRARSNEGSPGAKVCIILDHFESFLPLSRVGGDPYLPVLNSIGEANHWGMLLYLSESSNMSIEASYLSKLSSSLRRGEEFPYPSCPLYNINLPREVRALPVVLLVRVCLVGVMTCNDGSAIFRAAVDVLGGGRFKVPLPTDSVRLRCLEYAFDLADISLSDDAKKSLPELSSMATWVCGGGFEIVASELKSRVGDRLANEQDLKDVLRIDKALVRQTPSAFDSATFSTVGGNTLAKKALDDALALDPKKRRLLARLGLRPPSGVLLYGPPGNGKTLLAKAVASQMRATRGSSGSSFVSLKASDIVRPEVGNSEKLIVTAFEQARVNAPSVIFIDEFQALFGERDSGGFILGQLASTLLQCLDDVSRWAEISPTLQDDAGDRVVVLGATNAPWMIDKAFLRPRRFDRAVHVSLPTVDDIEEILRVHVRRMKLAKSTSIDEICRKMKTYCLGFSGADIAALCRASAVRCLSSGTPDEGVTEHHFVSAYMHDIVRSSNDDLVKRLANWHP